MYSLLPRQPGLMLQQLMRCGVGVGFVVDYFFEDDVLNRKRGQRLFLKALSIMLYIISSDVINPTSVLMLNTKVRCNFTLNCSMLNVNWIESRTTDITTAYTHVSSEVFPPSYSTAFPIPGSISDEYPAVRLCHLYIHALLRYTDD